MAPDDDPPDEDSVDRKLLREWAGGDVRAGDQLTLKYFDPIRSYFVRRAPDEHEDLVNKTFLGLAKSKDKYRGECTVRVFIYSIARNVLRGHLRALQRRPDFDPITTSMCEAWGRRPSSMLAQRQHRGIMLDALQEIPSEQQDLLELRYWQDLSGPELRDLFEIPEGTVRSRIAAAIKQLRTKFEEISERQVSEEDLARWLDDDEGE